MTQDLLDHHCNDLFKNNKNVLLEWATGTGKTRQAIRAIDFLDKEKHNSILIVVAETAHKKNWIEEFNKWNKAILSDINYDITLICYDSLHHYRDNHFDMVILDEAHHIGTEIRTDILRTISSDRFILLSATIEQNIIKEISDIIGYIKISRIPLQEAIALGLIPQPKIILVPMTLDNTIYNQEVIETRGNKDKLVTIMCSIKDKWKYLKNKKAYPNIKLIMKCTEQQKYNDLESKLTYYMKLLRIKNSESIKNKMLQYGSQRKTFLGLLKDKKAKEIISTFKNYRYLCFCANIEQADRLGGSHSIHSKKDNPLEVIDKFNNKEINSLYVVGMLKEGQNLVDIEKGVIIQLDGKIRSFIQKSGRILRAEKPEIYIIYFKGTQDEIYLNRALDGLNPEYIYNYENHN